LDASVGIDEVVAIKVSDAEEMLAVEQEKISADIRENDKKIHKTRETLAKVVNRETRKHYPELVKLEEMLKSVFKVKNSKLSIQLGDTVKGRIRVTLGHYSTDLRMKGRRSQKLRKSYIELDKKREKLEADLLNTRKKRSQLPRLERKVKAEVAKVKLGQTAQGRKILNSIGKVELKGLPASSKR
jgi:hypothetical protein